MTVLSFPTGLRLRDHEAVLVGEMIEFVAVGDLDGYADCLDQVADATVTASVASAVLDLVVTEALSVHGSLVQPRVETIKMMTTQAVKNSGIVLDADMMASLVGARLSFVSASVTGHGVRDRGAAMSSWRVIDHAVTASAVVLDAFLGARGDVVAQRAAAMLDLADRRRPADPFAADSFGRCSVPSVGAHIWAMARIAAGRSTEPTGEGPSAGEQRRAFDVSHRLLVAEAQRLIGAGDGLEPVLMHRSWVDHPKLWRTARIVLMDALSPCSIGDVSVISATDRVSAVVALLGCLLEDAEPSDLRPMLRELSAA